MKKILAISAVCALFQVSLGQVGIGTTNPQATLEIDSEGNSDESKALKVDNIDETEMLTILDNGNIGVNNDSPSSLLNIKGKGSSSATKSLEIINSNDEAILTARDDGNVGVNNADPNAALHITSKGNTNATKAFEVTNSASSDLITVLDNGNVGINTDNPTAVFEVDGGTGKSGIKFTNLTNSSATTDSNITYMAVDSGGNLVPTAIGKFVAGYRDSDLNCDGETYVLDEDLSLNLTPGIYEVTGMIIFTSDDDEDLRFAFNYGSTIPNGNYIIMGKDAATSGTSTTSTVNYDYNPWNEFITLGGANDTKMTTYLNGIINVSSNLTLQLKYRERDDNNVVILGEPLGSDAKVYAGSYIKAQRIQ